jgi:adenylosuccinate synthase
MVIDPSVLVAEIDTLKERGHPDVESRLLVSDRAHLILPYHIAIDTLREGSGGRTIGTTKKGIGPTYEDKVRRTGVRTGDLRDLATLRRQVAAALDGWQPILQALGGETLSADRIVADLAPLAERLVPLLGNTSREVDLALVRGADVLFEGAQGVLLDIDHGTYPYVTSSSSVAGGAATGSGVGPQRIDSVVGITKAYTTRVGAGPFPTELDDAAGQHLRDVGAEYGSVTGRPRRTGWLDLPALKYARRVSGIDQIALTKLDVLTGLSELKVCVAYETPEGRVDDFPVDMLERGVAVTPVYETLPGWTAALAAARSVDDLPAEARAYVDLVAERLGVPYCLISVGARRSESIELSRPFAR